jgi:hypothetical protein
MIGETPQLRSVAGATGEPIVRVMGHMLGGMLGLGTSSDETNLMALGTTGTRLDADQIRAVRGALAGEGVTRAPPAAEFLVLPLRTYILQSEFPALNAAPQLAGDMARIVSKINRIWSAAGIYFRLDAVAVVAANAEALRPAIDRLDPTSRAKPPLDVLPLAIPPESRSTVTGGFHIFYVHDFVANGVYPGKREAFVRETAKLMPIPGGIDEPLPRVTSHEIGHGLGLAHHEIRSHLMAEGTTGTRLDTHEVEIARAAARRTPGVTSAEVSGVVGEVASFADHAIEPWAD